MVKKIRDVKSVSKRLKKLLKRNNQNEMLRLLKHYPNGMNYFDISYSDKVKISYLKGDRIPVKSHLLYDKDYRKSNAYHAKVGKIFSKTDATPKQISDISALFYNIELTAGLSITDKIVFYYDEINYATKIEGYTGNLYYSCMRSSSLNDAIEFYEKLGKDTVQLLVLLDENKKVLGRALIWFKVEYSNKAIPVLTPYMDRVYTANENISELFYNYALSNEWTRYDSGRVKYVNNIFDTQLTVNIRNICNDDYAPYMDTFRYMNESITKISSNSDYYCYELSNTNGDMICDLQNENDETIYCEHCGDEIPYGEEVYDTNDNLCCQECAVYCEDIQAHVYREYARYVDSLDEYYTEDAVIFCNDGEYHLIDDCVYLEYFDEYFYLEDVIYSEILQKDVPRDCQDELEEEYMKENPEEFEEEITTAKEVK